MRKKEMNTLGIYSKRWDIGQGTVSASNGNIYYVVHDGCEPSGNTAQHSSAKSMKGFTLIELLFVIVVLGFVSVMGISFYQQRVQTQKVEKAVAQIEQWMQAGMAFYVKNKTWPASTQVLEQQGYMLLGSSNENPWCKEPVGTYPSTCYTVGPRGGQLFQVTVPQLPAAPADKAGVPQAIAARLPYVDGSVKQGQTEVRALVNIPLAAIDNPADKTLVAVFPFTLDKQTLVTQGNQMFVARKRLVVAVPNCQGMYGSRYNLKLYPVMKTSSVESNTGQQQPGLFSFLETVARTTSQDYVDVWVMFRPQSFKLDWNWNYYSERPPISELNIDFQGQVFAFCEKTS